MKISDLIAYLQKYQREFGDVDVELSLDGAKIGPDGKVPVKTLTPIPQTKDKEDMALKPFILQKKLADIFPDHTVFIPIDPPAAKKTFSWREAEEKLKDSPYINKDIDINILNKYFKYATLKP